MFSQHFDNTIPFSIGFLFCLEVISVIAISFKISFSLVFYYNVSKCGFLFMYPAWDPLRFLNLNISVFSTTLENSQDQLSEYWSSLSFSSVSFWNSY